MAKVMWALVNKATGELDGGGSGIYDNEQPPDGSTMKERIAQLIIKYPDHELKEWPLQGDLQPTAGKHHVVNGNLVDWTAQELKAMADGKELLQVEDQMIDIQNRIDAATTLNLADKKTTLEDELAAMQIKHAGLKQITK